MNIIVSVIIPVYNTEEYLRVCVDQILKQTIQDFEIILVDDGSSDRSLQVCKEMAAKDSRLRVIHQENAGVSVARNTGLEQVRGKYVAFVDSDDLIAPDYFAYLLSGMSEETVLSMCAQERIRNYNHQFPVVHEEFGKFLAQQATKKLLEGRFPVSACGGLFKQSLIGDCRFQAGIRNNEDKLFLYQYMLKAENGFVAFSNEKLYGYMVREGSATRNSWNGSADVVKVADQIREETKKNHPEWDDLAKNACMKARLDVMKSIIRSEGSDHSDETYEILREQVLSYSWPKTGSRRLKAEYLAVKLGRPAYRALVQTYYKLNNDDKRFKLNEKRTRQ